MTFSVVIICATHRKGSPLGEQDLLMFEQHRRTMSELRTSSLLDTTDVMYNARTFLLKDNSVKNVTIY